MNDPTGCDKMIVAAATIATIAGILTVIILVLLYHSGVLTIILQ